MGVITGLMGSGKTTLLYHLFGMAPPDLYTSTGVAEKSFRGLLHHIMQRFSAGAWKRITYKDIREFLAPLIRGGMNETRVDNLARSLLQSIDPSHNSMANPSSLILPHYSQLHKSHTSTEINREASSSTAAEKSHTGKAMVSLVREASGPTAANSPKDLILELVHMIDTGGQPELMEVMPSLIHNANLALVLVNLEYGLHECTQANYNVKGRRYERQMSSQFITGRDVILKLASTLQAKKICHEAFRLLVIATHRDCVKGGLQARVEALNSELQSLLLPTFEDELIIFETPDKIAYVLNLKNPDDHDKHALSLIRTAVSSPNLGRVFDTPSSFFIFEQDLLYFAKVSAKRDIVSLEECKQVGAKLKMSGEMVEAALVLFHRQNTFLYFRNVLPDHVFIEPQVPLDIINGIVRFSYKTFQGVPAKLVRLLKDGIITEELLSYDEISVHFKKGFYEIQDAIKLFCYTFILAPLQPDTGEDCQINMKNKQYLMMCLKPAIPNQELHYYIPKSSDTVPLVVKFSSGCVPLGCFGSTISCLLSQYGLKVLKEKGLPLCLAHNIAALNDPHVRVNVVLVDFTQHYNIYITSDISQFPSPETICNEVRSKVFGAVEKVFDIMQLDREKIKISSFIGCNCTEGEHFAEFTKDMLYCPKSAKLLKPDNKQLLWMTKETNLKPGLPQLICLKIPEKVGANYFKFGILLLDDRRGEQIQRITSNCQFQTESIVMEILHYWLTREPTPVTWEKLIQTLRSSDLNALADEVEKYPKTV